MHVLGDVIEVIYQYKCSYLKDDGVHVEQYFSETCEKEGFYSDPLDCSIFYRCINWGNSRPLTRFKFQCGLGTVFSQSMGNICVPPRDSERMECVELENEIQIDLESSTSNMVSKINIRNSNEMQHDILHRCSQPSTISREECRYLFSTTNIEKMYLPGTDNPSRFNKFKPYNDNNPIFFENENSLTKSQIFSQTEKAFDVCTHEGFVPDLKDCQKFYRCVQDQFGYRKFSFHCATGTAWDQNEQTCNYVSLVPTCNYANSTQTQSSFQSMGANRIPSTFSSTEKSINMGATRYDLSETTTSMYLFSSLSTLNDKESNNSVDSKDAVYNESCTSDCKLVDGVVCNIPGFYAHPLKCNKFYRCVDNGNGFNVYYFDCPLGTIFDPSINVCNYPESIYPPRKCVSTQHTSSSMEPFLTNPPSSTMKSQELSTLAYVTELTTLTIESNSSELTTSVSKNELSTEESHLTTEKIPPLDSTTSSETLETGEESNTTTMKFSSTLQYLETTTATEISTVATTAGSLTMTDGTLMTTSATMEKSTLSELETPKTEVNLESTTKHGVEVSTSITESVTKIEELITTNTIIPADNAFSNCPIASNITDEQVLLVCPTGFKRHPKFCNIIYQCTTHDNSQIKFLTLRCPENTIFDETKIQCVPESESSQPCEGSISHERIHRRSDSKRLLNIKLVSHAVCPDEGYYPFHYGCSIAFFKCKRNTRNVLQAYLYKCPPGSVFWTISKSCEKVSWLKTCTSQSFETEKIFWENRWDVPTENDNFYT
ncbi:uncharacterized protein LOC122507503 [Leptopilina heterotoma]|uniref:uncharacterized protein LOC122507503 n=1 Tax=Leptopilina heterotoma TaxID=63436 RepID=UPI001CA8545A|nr:uncharacterized protein LOC122507503 [Leptopilina heterotoma]